MQLVCCLSAPVLERVHSSCGVGLLIAYRSDGNLTVIDALHLDQEAAGRKADDHVLAATGTLLPGGLAFVGVYAPTRESAASLLQQQLVHTLLGAPSKGQETASHASHRPSSTGLPPEVVLVVTPKEQALVYDFYNLATAKWSDAPTPQIPQETLKAGVAQQWWTSPSPLLCSLSMSVPLDVYTTQADSSTGSLARAVRIAGTMQQEALSSSCDMLLLTSRDGTQRVVSAHGVSDSTPLEALASTGQAPSTLHTVSLTLQPLRAPHHTAGGGTHGSAGGVQEGSCHAPVYEYQVAAAGTLSHTRVWLHLSVLAYVPPNTAASQLGPHWLRPVLLSQLAAAVGSVATRETLTDVRAYHFLPPGRRHHVTLLYPEPRGQPIETVEHKLATFRRAMHQALGLPLNRPLLRAANACDTSLGGSDSPHGPAAQLPAGTQRLRDVHVGLSNPVAGGTVAMVDGSYDYHHYMQDRFNDNGWGCAYRSLQTLVSWFRCQQYTHKPVPSHKEVQQLLVQLGDKPPEFVGSSQWIGAIELSYILDSYLGITSKIITVNRGADIPSRARELAAHFNSQGTPVMIGGGVLAYTLLGVSFNELTGECAFLILDPHYTGGEELRKIQSGTWVAWKKPGDNAAAGGPLFVQDAFYNFLCPQRPQEV